jgi:putative two-component system response regulator
LEHNLQTGQNQTILVVDDTPDNLALMSDLLKNRYRVKLANNGAKAIQIALSDTPPDLILLDIMMPEMDGYEVCR